MRTVLLFCLISLLLSASSSDPTPVNFATLSNYTYEEGMKIPASVNKFHEKRITVSGFMKSEDGSPGEFEYFVLVNDACGCEGIPMLNEMIFCAMPEGELAKIKPGSATITGTLYIEEEIEDGIVLSLYTMSAESVEAP